MDFKITQDTLIIAPKGKVDSANAAEVEIQLFDVCRDNPASKVVLDCQDLVYLSSAGLRIVLKLRKTYPSLRLVNVQSEVYDIFEMTGFTEMMPIEKAFRTRSVEGCKVIGQGANGMVYRVGDDTIIKVYRNPDSLDDIRRERELAKRAFILGIPTAISYEVAKVGDGYGSVFEMLDAKSIAELLSSDPDKLDAMADLYVGLLHKIHETTGDRAIMPDMKETALDWANFDRDYLDPADGDKLLRLVEALPQSDKMLHGDYHIKNVMISGGEALLIDMDTICVGHPIFELGSMYNAYLGFAAVDPEASSAFLGIPRPLAISFWQLALRKYLKTDDPKRVQEVEDKAALIGTMRLIRRLVRRNQSNPSYQKDLKQYCNQMKELLSHVDTLDF